MVKFLGALCAGAIFAFGAVSCSASGEAPTGVQRQAVGGSCVNDLDCDLVYPPGGGWPDFFAGEHCGMDGYCHTVAEDPSCGLWWGTYPDCPHFYPGDARPGHCASEDLWFGSNCEVPDEP